MQRRTRAGTLAVLATTGMLAVATPASATTDTFNYTGAVQTWIVPVGVTSATFNVQGAQGGTGASSAGGMGGSATATIAVTPGATVSIFVGGAGGNAAGGFNGGGNGVSGGLEAGAGGGGATDIRIGGIAGLSDRVLVAGGGGGGGGCDQSPAFPTAGLGGGTTGGDATSAGGCAAGIGTTGGTGGTQTGGGTNSADAGRNGALGTGGSGFQTGVAAPYGTAGGGGGYYGGAGGYNLGAGGGGSGYGPAGVAFQTGVRSGNGVASVTYGPPSITSADNTTFAVGSAGSFTVATSPGSPAATTLSKAGALPNGVTFTDNGNGTATLSGTPAAGSGGSYPLTITASNGVNPDATQAFTLSTREAPLVTTDPSPRTANVGDTVTFTAAASGFPAPAVQWQRSTNGGASFSDIAGATGNGHSFTVASGDSGNRYRAVYTNAVGSATSAAATLTLIPRTLTVFATGSGFGTVTGAGIDCGAGGHNDCSETVTDGSTITLTAAPNANSDFAGFTGGGCSGSDATCTVSMNAAKSVTATFTLKRHALSITRSGSGSGSVSSSPAGLDCPGVCGADVDEGTAVTLTAHPDPGSDFEGFSGGDCTGSGNTCTVTVGSALASVDAKFEAVPETTIGRTPKNRRSAHSHFGFRSSIPGSAFVCSLDNGSPEPCRPPKDYRGLEPGRHVFSVVATGPNGKADPTPATARFRVK